MQEMAWPVHARDKPLQLRDKFCDVGPQSRRCSLVPSSVICCTALQGVQPSVQTALDLYNILVASGTDLRLPVGLENQLMADNDLDSEVGKSMLQLLKVTGCAYTRFCQ